MVSFAAARRMMVDGQVRPSDVTDGRIIAAMGEIPRERFVPPNQVGLAYLDRDVPVGAQRSRALLKPMVLAKLIQAADIGPHDSVLDVGGATGYSAAVLAHLAAAVVTVEEDAELAGGAERLLRELGLSRVTVRTGPLPAGSPADGPFDAILVNGVVECRPDGLCGQLKDGGRLVCILRVGPVGKATLYCSTGGVVSGRPLFDAGAAVLPGFVEPPAFVF